MTDFYVQRNLYLASQDAEETNQEHFPQTDLFEKHPFSILLAEPGEGKTSLLNKLAKQHTITAEKFRCNLKSYKFAAQKVMILDAFDEAAIKNKEAIDALVLLIEEVQPKQFILASRVTEWSMGYTEAIRKALQVPKLPELRIQPLCIQKQKEIYEHQFPKDSFDSFIQTLATCQFTSVASNPLYLKIFGEALLKPKQTPQTIKGIYTTAIQSFAKDVRSSKLNKSLNLLDGEKITYFNEICTKILLANLAGLSCNNESVSEEYPMLTELMDKGNILSSNLLDSGLFRLANESSCYEPIHRTIAEYSAAKYLNARLRDPKDSLCLDELLSIIAPQGVPRKDLKGLIGWLGVHGDQQTQETLVKSHVTELIANIDAASLDANTKAMILNQLLKLEQTQPYFFHFNFKCYLHIDDFNNNEEIEFIKERLKLENKGCLRDLFLELIPHSKNISTYKDSLQTIKLDKQEEIHTRKMASHCLNQLEKYDFLNDFNTLLQHDDASSLEMIGYDIEKLGSNKYDFGQLKEFITACERLAAKILEPLERIHLSRYFIKQTLQAFHIEHVIKMLDTMIPSHHSNCAYSRGKICGYLLDSYFNQKHDHHDILKIVSWLKPLRFKHLCYEDQSVSVKVLKNNVPLRHQVLTELFKNMNDSDEFHRYIGSNFNLHSGLETTDDDQLFILQLAYDKNNTSLWKAVLPSYKKSDKYDITHQTIVKLARKHAKQNSNFMQIFSVYKLQQTINPNFSKKYRAKQRRLNRKNSKANKALRCNIKQNEPLIMQGQNLKILANFSSHFIQKNKDGLEQYGAQIDILKNAVLQVAPTLVEQVPSLKEWAMKTSSGQYTVNGIYFIFIAYCIFYWQKNQSIDAIDAKFLRFYKVFLCYRTTLKSKYADEHTSIINLIDQKLLADHMSHKQFLKTIIEPQLQMNQCPSHHFCFLDRKDNISDLHSELALEWLNTYPSIKDDALKTLFGLAANSGKLSRLQNIIRDKADYFLKYEREKTAQRDFWLTRGFFFLDDSVAHQYFSDLNTSPESIFNFKKIDNHYNSEEYYYPRLSPQKVKMLLEAYFDHWPAVELPSVWCASKEDKEAAYRYLTNLIWHISKAEPNDAFPVLQELVANPKYMVFHNDFKHMIHTHIENNVQMQNNQHSLEEINDFLDKKETISVAHLRSVILSELVRYQDDISYGAFNTYNRFYNNNKRLAENPCSELVAERLDLVLRPRNISLAIEEQLQNQTRVDIAATQMFCENKYTLMIEAKGQWHPDLYTAVENQLAKYGQNPAADNQGIFLVYWFGKEEKVADKDKHGIESAQCLQKKLEDSMPEAFKNSVDVFVLDLTKPDKPKKNKVKKQVAVAES